MKPVLLVLSVVFSQGTMLLNAGDVSVNLIVVM